MNTETPVYRPGLETPATSAPRPIAEQRPQGSLTAAYATATGSAHSRNEDCCCHVPSANQPVFCGVADGVGGGAHGEIASSVLLNHCAHAPESARNDPARLVEWLALADAEVRTAIARRTDQAGAATLAAAWFPTPSTALVLNVGDCRVYQLKPGRDGYSIHRLTVDQTYATLGQQPPPNGKPDDPARMVGAGAVGTPPVVKAHIRERDLLLFCSDGVHKYVPDEDIARLVSSNLAGRKPLEKICDALVRLAKTNGSQDDASALLVMRRPVPFSRWIYGLAVIALLVLSLLAGAQIAFAETRSIIDPTESPAPPPAAKKAQAEPDEATQRKRAEQAEQRRVEETERRRARTQARAAERARHDAVAREAAAREAKAAAAREAKAAAVREAAAQEAARQAMRRAAAARQAAIRAAAAKATQAKAEAEREASRQDAMREAARVDAMREAARELAAREAAREVAAREAAAREAAEKESIAREAAAREASREVNRQVARHAAANYAANKLLASRSTRPAPRIGAVFRDCPECPELVWLPPGESVLGDAGGRRPMANIDYPLAVGRFEVTFAEWDACVNAGECRRKPRDAGWGRGRQPVIDISWQEARQYTAWLSRRTGKNYRLLTEAEWEYAARAGTDARYWWGNETRPGAANCAECGTQWDGRRPAPVGSFAPNPFGLYDMNGNVWEWVEDCSYDCSTQESQVVRGGAWGGNSHSIRSAARSSVHPGYRDYRIGLRIARID